MLLGRERAPGSVSPRALPPRPSALQTLLCSHTPEPRPGLLPQLGTGSLSPQLSKRTFLTIRCCCPHVSHHGLTLSQCRAQAQSVPKHVLGDMAIAATKVPPGGTEYSPAKYLPSPGTACPSPLSHSPCSSIS